MRATEFTSLVQEYEQGTPRAREINQTLTQAGYRRLGGGVDAAAWRRDDDTVIKIIMPETSDSRPAMKTFKRFFRLTQARPSPHWPRYRIMRDEYGQESVFAKFQIQGRTYLQIAMERLYPLNDIDRVMIQDMSDTIERGRSFQDWQTDNQDEWHTVESWLKKNQQQLPGLYAAMRAAYKQSDRKYEWDLHGGNVMKRRDGTFVITDPWIRFD
jgi:hypothetical protein